jgi:HK97 gp10 family phage protein
MVDGVAQLTRKLTKDVPARVQAAARAAMEQGADETVAMMKRLAPVLKRPDDRRRAGALRDSIGWTWGEAPAGSFIIGTVQGRDYKTMRITIYAGTRDKKLGADDAFYARWVEFGTVKMTAQPFFFVSWRSMKKRVRSRIARNVRKAIKAEGGQ